MPIATKSILQQRKNGWWLSLRRLLREAICETLRQWQPELAAKNYTISFSLKPDGAAKFGAWTGANINEYLGVVLNDEVKSIAFIKSQIDDQGEISGRFTKQSAEDLALVLRAGALPVPVRFVEERVDK